MVLVRLICVSKMTEACDLAAIENILKVSRRKNAARRITGMLCYDPMFFMQCLEGPKKAVNDLFGDLARDNRHSRVTILEYQDIETRSFSEWSMAFVQASELDAKMLRKYGSRGKLDPFELSTKQARNLVVDIVKLKRKQILEVA